jgi:hypothetical protein
MYLALADQFLRHLLETIHFDFSHPHPSVALALGYQLSGDLPQAKKFTIDRLWPPTPGISWPSRT